MNNTNPKKFGLHDCRSNHIEYSDDTLIFDFKDGIYYLDSDEPKRTGKAQMKCHIIDMDLGGIAIYIYKTNKNGETVREDRSATFINELNNGLFEFEFITQYDSFNRVLFKGEVFFDEEPYRLECEIELLTDDITFVCLL